MEAFSYNDILKEDRDIINTHLTKDNILDILKDEWDIVIPNNEKMSKEECIEYAVRILERDMKLDNTIRGKGMKDAK